MFRATSLVIGLCLTGVSGHGGQKQPSEVSVEKEFLNVNEAHYVEFGPDCGQATSAKTCWPAANGDFIAYGCMADEERVFTKVCDSSDCAFCEPWQWTGEELSVCYVNDADASYQYFCGPAVMPEEEKPTARTCAQLGWIPNAENRGVCASSKVNGECLGDMNYEAASETCTAMGARLCTSAELLNNVAIGTGCKADCAAVWASDDCQTGHRTSDGSNKCGSSVPSTCSEIETATVRCCADGVVEAAYPEGFSMAVSLNYAKGDEQCGVFDSTEEYSCWVDPVDRSAMRFACHDDNNFIHYQICSSESCDPHSCRGEWKQTGEWAGHCYTHENYLYHYTCPDKK